MHLHGYQLALPHSCVIFLSDHYLLLYVLLYCIISCTACILRMHPSQECSMCVFSLSQQRYTFIHLAICS